VLQDIEDLTAWDLTRYGPQNPIKTAFVTSCMDNPGPFVGDHPCCSTACKDR
jgi:hypothetical protein